MSSADVLNTSPPAANCWEIFAVIGVAVLFRGAVLWQLGDQLREDRDGYREISQHIAQGHGFTTTGHNTVRSPLPTAYRPPLYPSLLAPLLLVSGHNPWAIGAMQLVLGSLTAGWTVALGRRLGLGRASLAAGLLVAADPLLLVNVSLVMTETLAAFLAVLVLWSLVRARRDVDWTIAGAVFGLCVLCRPTFWAFAVVGGAGRLAGWLWSHWRKSAHSGAEPALRWRPMAGLVVGALVVIVPWVVRNIVTLGSPIVTTTHGGYTLLLAHNPVYTREVVDRPWGAVWSRRSLEAWWNDVEFQMVQANPELSWSVAAPSPTVEIARDRWMYDTAWNYVRSEPRTAVRCGLTLLGRFWNIVPLAAGDAYRLSRFLGLAIGGFYVLTLVAMFSGLYRLRTAFTALWWLPVSLILSFSAVHTLYWADMRMRAPLIPAIALLAARGIVRTASDVPPAR